MPYIDRIELATKYAWSMMHRPYIWGGDDPMAGFDCSGLCVEILKGVGIFPRGGDWNAQMMWDQNRDKEVERPEEGALVFWWNKAQTEIVHVEYCLDHIYSIGASGGGRSTRTIQDAIDQNACVKLRPFRSRPRIAGFIYFF